MKKIHTLTLSSMDRKRERKLTRSVTEQQQQKKKLLQLNQYRYEADFRIWQVLDIYRALDMSEPISLK